MDTETTPKLILKNTNSDNDSILEDLPISVTYTKNSPISTKFTVLSSGHPIINELDAVKHKLEPELKLPTLKERASMSRIKDLYTISKQLIPSDDEESQYISEDENDESLIDSKFTVQVVKDDRKSELSKSNVKVQKQKLKQKQKSSEKKRYLFDNWLWCTLLIMVCTSSYTLYITQNEICDWQIKKTFYESLKGNSNVIMKWYYTLRIWMVEP